MGEASGRAGLQYAASLESNVEAANRIHHYITRTPVWFKGRTSFEHISCHACGS